MLQYTCSIGFNYMRKDKNRALKLRLKGKSYNEIHRELGIPKATLSNWFADLVLPKKALQRIDYRVSQRSYKKLIERNKRQTYLAIQRARDLKLKARSEIKNISSQHLRFIGIALYWAEGYKRFVVVKGRKRTYHPVSLSNSDQLFIKVYLRFLREICGVRNDHIMANIRIYDHMDQNYLLDYWSKITKLPRNNFGKTYYGVSISSKRKRPYNRLKYGTIQIRVNNTQLFYKIMGWIEGIAQSL